MGESEHDDDKSLSVRAPSRGSSTQKVSNRTIDHHDILWEATTKGIDSLFKLAAAIRDSDNSSGDTETPAHYSRPDDLYFEEIAKLFVRRCFPHARRDLSDQLGHAIYIRRRKILYRQRHEEKLQFPRLSMTLEPFGIQTAALPGELSDALNITTNHRLKQLQANEGIRRAVAPSLTQFSQFQTQSTIMRRTRAETTIAGRNTGSVVFESVEFDYPDPPKDLGQQAFLPCPYCCKQLTPSQRRNWR